MKINFKMAITNRPSFVFPKISLTQVRSCHPKRSTTAPRPCQRRRTPPVWEAAGMAGLAGGSAGCCQLWHCQPWRCLPCVTTATPAYTAVWKSQGKQGLLPSCPQGTGRWEAHYRASEAPLSCFVLKVLCFLLQSSARGFFDPPTQPFPCNFWHKREQFCR